MKKIFLNNKFIIIITIIVFISSSESDTFGPLNATSISPIDTNIEDEIVFNSFAIEENNDEYFSYNLTRNKSETNIVLTINFNSSLLTNIDIKCIYSDLESDDLIIEQFGKNESVCSIYKHKNNKIINLISEYKKDYKLYIKINSDSNAILNFYVRKNSYQNELKSMEISDAFAYTAFEFNKENYYREQYLLTSSVANSLLIYGEKNNEISQIDETSVIGISEQSIAAHFWDFEKIIIFAGKTEKEEDNNINIILSDMKNENTKIYYYKGDKEDYFKWFISFYYDCKDNSKEFYLIVNYGYLAEKDIYFEFHNLIGTTAFYAEFPPGEDDITKLNYQKVYRFRYLTQTDYHINAFKLKCLGDGEKIVANIKYNVAIPFLGNCDPSSEEIRDCNSNNYVLYRNLLPSNITEFALDIFTPESVEIVNFQVVFEENTYTMNNKFANIFKIKNKYYKELEIKSGCSKKILSFSPTIKTKENNSIKKYIQINKIHKDNKYFYSYYELEHEYKNHYHLNLEIKNEKDYIIPICYYLFVTSLLHNFAQNCFLLPAKETKNLTFTNIFEYNFNEPQYTIVIYNNHNGFDYNVSNVYLTADDADKSTPINNFYDGHDFLYVEDTGIRAPLYYNVFLGEKGGEKHIDFFIFQEDTSGNKELPIEVKCITGYEVGIQFVEPFFTNDNNLCHIINNNDYNSKVFHIIFNYTYHEKEKLIIKVTPKTRMKFKLVIDKNGFISKNFEFNEGINIIKEPSVYKIFEIDKEILNQKVNKTMMLYNKDDFIEFYGRSGNNFKQIYNSPLLFIKNDELKENFDSFFLVFGRNNCSEFCEQDLKYKLKMLENVFYNSAKEFNESNRFSININNCNVNQPYYLVFDYGKNYLTINLSLAYYSFYGNIENSFYIESFPGNEFDSVKNELKNYQIINQNDNHLSIISFQCKNNLFAYFDYFGLRNELYLTIQLEIGSIRYFNLLKNYNYTIKYKLINDIKIDLLQENVVVPSIYFENKPINIEKGKSIILSRGSYEFHEFYLKTPETNNIALRIISFCDVKSLPKTKIENLYETNNKFIYQIPDKALNVTINIERVLSSLRLLIEENDNGIEICYNAANIVILDKNNNNCFYVKKNYNLTYTVPQKEEGNTISYIVLYSKDEDQKFSVKSADPYIEGGDDDNKDNKGNNDENDKKENGKNVILIAIIIIAVLIILIIIIVIVIKVRKKGVTSEEIEKEIEKINYNSLN